mmetsp:Transcript_37915/g.120843  ORF Transcript_37915/g.120843 Transcript_37915/m.120843 type:complete len:221 (-) Transcript_37915:764-1426(-)
MRRKLCRRSLLLAHTLGPGLGLGLGLGRRIGTAGGLGAAGGLFSFLILQLQGRPRVVSRQERDGHAPCELKMHGQAANTSTIRVARRVQRGLREAALELRLELVCELRRHRQQRCAGVDHCAASAILAKVHDTLANAHAGDLDHPVPFLWQHHGGPSQVAAHVRRGVPTKGDLADLVVAVREEDAEARLLQRLLPGEHAEHAELRRDREAVQAKAHDAIK